MGHLLRGRRAAVMTTQSGLLASNRAGPIGDQSGPGLPLGGTATRILTLP
jgi:hypothetical protein